MNIDDMKPGRELDALVAEKVMGWKWEEYWTAIGMSGHEDKIGLVEYGIPIIEGDT